MEVFMKGNTLRFFAISIPSFQALSLRSAGHFALTASLSMGTTMCTRCGKPFYEYQEPGTEIFIDVVLDIERDGILCPEIYQRLVASDAP
jgi:hypothetical protein